MMINSIRNLMPQELPQMQALGAMAPAELGGAELKGLGIKGAGAAGAAGGVGGVGGGDFSQFLNRAVSEVDGKLQAADAEKTKLLTGETSNVHQAVIAMQEASVAFSLMVEVRNKLVESYQELMRMQM